MTSNSKGRAPITHTSTYAASGRSRESPAPPAEAMAIRDVMVGMHVLAETALRL